MHARKPLSFFLMGIYYGHSHLSYFFMSISNEKWCSFNRRKYLIFTPEKYCNVDFKPVTSARNAEKKGVDRLHKKASDEIQDSKWASKERRNMYRNEARKITIRARKFPKDLTTRQTGMHTKLPIFILKSLHKS